MSKEKKRIQIDLNESDAKLLASLKEKQGRSALKIIQAALYAAEYFHQFSPDDRIEIKKGNGEVIYLGPAKYLQR